MKDYKTYYYKEMPYSFFGVDIFLKTDLKHGKELKMHWHEHMQVYYFISGTAILECGKKRFQVQLNDIVIINSSELHYMKSLSDDLKFYVIRINLPFLFSNQVDLCQTKFLAPLSQNRITFRNLIQNDTEILNCVNKMINEYHEKKIGFELEVKSTIYELIVFLLRGHMNKVITNTELSSKISSLKRFDSILNYIEGHYTEKISSRILAKNAHISECYFCRTFKQITGKKPTDYINEIRLKKSAKYLKTSELNISEIALKCGFDDINYYSRLFKKYFHVSPTKFREKNI
ncbi:MAG: AraC family transcriptional regulator [Clostridia bacterium]|jgi:AraC-like DNA-binding protein|nr:AraC family transcriptional regulator [Clostridia bacterium]